MNIYIIELFHHYDTIITFKMGNCTGVFQACCGDDNSAVKRIDKESIKSAI
jgi:hypothetical protein